MLYFDWRKNDMARADALAAQERVAQGCPLNTREWTMWVWIQTDVPTCTLCPLSNGDIRLGKDGYYEQTFLPRPAPQYRHMPGLSYLTPAEIARKNSAWDKASGGRLGKWVLMIADKIERELALRAHGSLAQYGDTPPCKEDAEDAAPRCEDRNLVLVGEE